MALDPYIANVDLLLNFNGVDGETTIVPDIGDSALVVFGDVALDTTIKKFGTASALSGGTIADYLEYGVAGEFDYLHTGLEDYTMEGFFHTGALVDNQVIFSTREKPASISSPGVRVSVLSTGAIAYAVGKYNAGILFIYTIDGIVLPDTMYYFSVTYEVGVGYELKLDAANAVSNTATGHETVIASGVATLFYQHTSYVPDQDPFAGNLDSIRITRGVTRVITAVPTEEFPDVLRFSEEVGETFGASATLLPNYAQRVVEELLLSAPIQTFYNPTTSITEYITAAAANRTVLVTTIAEQVTAIDTLSVTQVIELAEELQATGQVETLYQGFIDVLAAMLVGDREANAYATKVSDALTVSDAVQMRVTRVAAQLDQILVTAQFENVLTILVEETAHLAAADSIELTRSLLVELLDTVDVYTLMKTPSELAQGVAVNLDGAMPISEYDNYTFNSMVSYKDKFYGASDAGLYLLDGDDDDGTNIQAEVSSLLLDLGTSRQKRMRSAYLGYTSTGKLVLRVRSVSQGQFTEDWYEARQVDADDTPAANMMQIGQGLKSRYWQFELTNVDGADFEIDLLEMHALFLSRRI